MDIPSLGGAWEATYGSLSMVGKRSPKPSMRVRFLPPVLKEDNMNKVINYCKACYDELANKTSWPTGSELTHSAMVVLSASLVIAVVVFCMDTVFRTVMSAIYPN